MRKSLRLLSSFIALISLVLVASAGSIDNGVVFQTENVSYYTNTTFNFTNITVYNESLYINNGNLTIIPASYANVTLDTLGSDYFNFSNNVTLDNISINDGFANFSANNLLQYTLSYLNNTPFQTVYAILGVIDFINAGSNSWSVHEYSGVSNLVNFTFTNKAISESQIYQSSQSTRISVDVNDSDGYLTDVIVGITYLGVEFNYSMSGGNDTWIYDFKTSVTGTYTVTGFYATDNATGTNSSAWNQVFYVVPVSAGGSSGVPAETPFILFDDIETFISTGVPIELKEAKSVPEGVLNYWASLSNQTKWVAIILILLGLYWESGRKDTRRRR